MQTAWSAALVRAGVSPLPIGESRWLGVFRGQSEAEASSQDANGVRGGSSPQLIHVNARPPIVAKRTLPQGGNVMVDVPCAESVTVANRGRGDW